MKCKLCLEKDLDNTGAHLITESLIRKAISAENTKGRDNEFMYSMSTKTLGKLFIGRNLSPEKIEKLKGRKLTTKEIDENENLLIDKNLVCYKCERKFHPIESYFMETILPKIDSIKTNDSSLLSEKDSKILKLFILINLWRISRSENTEFKLNGKVENHIRKFILPITGNDIDKILTNLDFEINVIKNLLFVSFYLEHETGGPSENMILLDCTKDPILLVLNKVIILIFYKYPKKYQLSAVAKDTVTKSKIDKTIKKQGGQMLIRVLSDKKRKLLLKKIVSYQGNEIVNKTMKIIESVHIEMYGFIPHTDIYKYVLKRIINLPSDGLSTTISSITEIIGEALLKAGEYYKLYKRSH